MKKKSDIRELEGENFGLSRQKQKLLIMKQILLEKTDEQNPLTCNDFIGILASYGIKAERKTIYDDIATIGASGLDIEVTKKGHANAYYVSKRLFDLEELFVLADAVASSRFLTQKRSKQLISKLSRLTSEKLSKNIQREIFVENRVKAYNENIFYAINGITQAIINKKIITFQYFDYDFKKRQQLRHGGEYYKVSPYYLVWNMDKYYLIGYNHNREKVVFFRVDKMLSVRELNEKRLEPNREQEEYAKALRTTFDMYSGSSETVTFEVHKSLINTMLDRFGMKINFFAADGKEDYFTFKAEVQISPTFWGWLFTFGNKIKIISPQNVVSQAAKASKEIYEMYDL